MLTDNAALISDLENDYKKLSVECKKKYNIIREVIDISMKAIEKLITIAQDKEKSQTFNQELVLSIEILLKPISIIVENKHIKLFYYSIIIIKKLVTYNFVSVNESNGVINILKELFDNSNEEIQLKILETVQSMVNSNKISPNEKAVSNLLSISCKMFGFKSVEFKNPIKLLFKTLIKEVSDSIQKDSKNEEKIKGGSVLIRELIEISEGKKKEWILPSIYSKCLGLELLCNFVSNSSSLFKEIEEYGNLIKNEIFNLIQKTLPSTNDLIVGAKLIRLSIIIISQLNFCYDLIETIIKFAKRDNLCWQKIIGLEGLSEIISQSDLLFTLFITKKELYENIINSLTDITYKNVIIKKAGDNLTNRKNEKKQENLNNCPNSKTGKILHNSSMLMEGESLSVSITYSNLFKILSECYVNLKDSYIFLMEKYNIKINQLNGNLSEKQQQIKNFLQFQYFSIKGALIGLLINSSDEGTTQNYLSIFQSLITLYASISLKEIRDEYINDLCKLALPNNLENFDEMKEKNILITRTIFNMVHCVNLLDYSSWVILLDIIQTLYNILIKSHNYITKPNEKFDIDVISNNLEMNIKKYSYDTPSMEIHQIIKKNEENVNFNLSPKISKQLPKETGKKKSNNSINTSFKKQLTEEEKENMLILSTVIDTLFIDSNLFDPIALGDISTAFKDSSLKLINCIESDPQNETYKTFLQFNLIKILELTIVNINRIDIIWDKVGKIIELISMKNISEVSKFTIDILGIIIIFSLRTFKQRKTSESKGEENIKIEKEENNTQKLLFSPLITLINSNNQGQNEINECVISNLSKILQKSGTFLNNSGWGSYIEILYLLTKKENPELFEKVFKIIEEIFNEYSSYLMVENIEPMLNILEQFSLSKQNDNISYSAIALFFTCANITEKHQKRSTNEKEFYKKEWLETFKILSNLNKDERYDIRKSGITVFAQLYEGKIKSLFELNISGEIASKLFIEVLKKNYSTYSEKSESKEWEDTVIISLQGIGKVFRAYLTQEEENEEKLYEQLMIILLDISKYSTPEIKINVIKILIEIPSYETKIFFSHFGLVMDIMIEIGNYLVADTFIKKYSAFNIGNKLILFVLDTFKLFFISLKENKEIISNEDYIIKMFTILSQLMSSSKQTEKGYITTNPSKLIRNEKEIFDFIDELIKAAEEENIFKQIYKFLSSFIKLDTSDKHNETLSHRALKSMESIFNNKKLNLEFKFNK